MPCDRFPRQRFANGLPQRSVAIPLRHAVCGRNEIKQLVKLYWVTTQYRNTLEEISANLAT